MYASSLFILYVMASGGVAERSVKYIVLHCDFTTQLPYRTEHKLPGKLDLSDYYLQLYSIQFDPVRRLLNQDHPTNVSLLLNCNWVERQFVDTTLQSTLAQLTLQRVQTDFKLVHYTRPLIPCLSLSQDSIFLELVLGRADHPLLQDAYNLNSGLYQLRAAVTLCLVPKQYVPYNVGRHQPAKNI